MNLTHRQSESDRIVWTLAHLSLNDPILHMALLKSRTLAIYT